MELGRRTAGLRVLCSRLLDLDGFDLVPRLRIASRITLPDGPKNVYATGDLPEDAVPIVQMRRRGVRDEELAAVRVWPGVGH